MKGHSQMKKSPMLTMLRTPGLHWVGRTHRVPHDDITREGDAAGKDCEAQLESMRYEDKKKKGPTSRALLLDLEFVCRRQGAGGLELTSAGQGACNDEIGAYMAD